MSFVYVYIISIACTVHLSIAYTMLFKEVSNDKIILEVCENSTLECFPSSLRPASMARGICMSRVD